jgi:hypothetical protein
MGLVAPRMATSILAHLPRARQVLASSAHARERVLSALPPLWATWTVWPSSPCLRYQVAADRTKDRAPECRLHIEAYVRHRERRHQSRAEARKVPTASSRMPGFVYRHLLLAVAGHVPGAAPAHRQLLRCPPGKPTHSRRDRHPRLLTGRACLPVASSTLAFKVIRCRGLRPPLVALRLQCVDAAGARRLRQSQASRRRSRCRIAARALHRPSDEV